MSAPHEYFDLTGKCSKCVQTGSQISKPRPDSEFSFSFLKLSRFECRKIASKTGGQSPQGGRRVQLA